MTRAHGQPRRDGGWSVEAAREEHVALTPDLQRLGAVRDGLCVNCGGAMLLKARSAALTSKLGRRLYYACVEAPTCKAPIFPADDVTGAPSGVTVFAVDAELRSARAAARITVRRLHDPLVGFMTRYAAMAWVSGSASLRQEHWMNLDLVTCVLIITLVERRLALESMIALEREERDGKFR